VLIARPKNAVSYSYVRRRAGAHVGIVLNLEFQLGLALQEGNTTMDRRRCLSCSGLFTTLIALLAVLPCRAAPPTVFPGAQWTEATPESQGVDREKLREAAELLARTVGAPGE